MIDISTNFKDIRGHNTPNQRCNVHNKACIDVKNALRLLPFDISRNVEFSKSQVIFINQTSNIKTHTLYL